MKISEVRLSCGKTINLGNWQNIRIDAGVTAQLEPGENLDEISWKLQQKLKALLEDTYRSQLKGEAAPTREPLPSSDELPPTTFTPAGAQNAA